MTLPHLEVLRGRVLDSGVSEAPEIRIASVTGDALTVSATAEQVEQAALLRGDARPVTAMVALGPRPRLLWIRPEGVEKPPPSAQEREEHALRKWSEVLRRLAQ